MHFLDIIGAEFIFEVKDNNEAEKVIKYLTTNNLLNRYEICEITENISDVSLEIAVYTDKIYELEMHIPKLEAIIEHNFNVSRWGAIKQSAQSQKNVTQVISNSFIVLSALITGISIFNTISSSVMLRKKDLATLSSIGMSNKQINKMVILEGIFYGLDAIFYGILLSLIILWSNAIYTKITYKYAQSFHIPWIEIGIVITIIYTVIFLSIKNARRKMRQSNIIDEIKNENI